ncbi:MAG TPA: FAD-dependent oxidoreductase [Bryobacteraceae bacterium]
MTLAVLGAGPAGVGAAFQAARRKLGRTVVLEQRGRPGGNAGSFDLEGLRVDYGSHRLHPACDPGVLADLKALLGDDLKIRPRHGRILLRNSWIHFPLQPLDLALHVPKSFLFGAAADIVRKRFAAKPADESFASVLEAGLGRTICRDFYFPFARKLWGLDPAQLSPIQARRRVSANTGGRMLRKIKPAGAGRFYYPRRGYGQIFERLHEEAAAQGAEFLFGSKVTGIQYDGGQVACVHYERNGAPGTIDCQFVLSTLPINLLVRSMRPEPPADIIEAAARMSFRAMILIYLVLDQDRFTEYDAHYFPEERIPISRLSEPKNYSGVSEPRGLTALCAELPCDAASATWAMSDAALGDLVRDTLRDAGIPIRATIRKVVTRRLAHAYPIYERGFEAGLGKVDGWAGGFRNLVTFGRQGLFAHDNAHHALYMAYCAVNCMRSDGEFQWERWKEYRREFESHVVED